MRFSDYLANFQDGYDDCEEWVNQDSEDYLPEYSWSEDYVQERLTDTQAFVSDNWDLLQESNLSPKQAGCDFYLTRNRHGTGFWDEGLGEIGQRLTGAAHVYGETYPY